MSCRALTWQSPVLPLYTRRRHPLSLQCTLKAHQQRKHSFGIRTGNQISSIVSVRWTEPRVLSRPHRDIFTNCPRKRTWMSSSTLFTILTPPATFVGLLAVLWIYKCFMMILFQDKIIYMPSVPPFSRREKIEDYSGTCKPVHWTHETITSLDGMALSLCSASNDEVLSRKPGQSQSRAIVLYFQGNASSLPPRLPVLTRFMKEAGKSQIPVTLIALSYRGFWTSRGRATQSGIERDAMAALLHCVKLRKRLTEASKIVIWGQSIGAGVATATAATSLKSVDGTDLKFVQPAVDGVVLETPFVSIRSMLAVLYPQRWLPYKYLWPFLWNRWDSEDALKEIARKRKVPVMIAIAEKDEVVPANQGDLLADLCRSLGLPVDRVVAKGALHHEASSKQETLSALVHFIATLSKPDK